MKTRIDWKKEYILLWQALTNCFHSLGVDTLELCEVLWEAKDGILENGSDFAFLRDLPFTTADFAKSEQSAEKFLQYLKEHE